MITNEQSQKETLEGFASLYLKAGKTAFCKMHVATNISHFQFPAFKS